MKRFGTILIATSVLTTAGAAWCARGTDTAWKDYASELPPEVRERLQSLRGSNSSSMREHRQGDAAKKDAKLERERFLQSLPESERERLRQKIRQIEEHSSSSQGSKSFRDK